MMDSASVTPVCVSRQDAHRLTHETYWSFLRDETGARLVRPSHVDGNYPRRRVLDGALLRAA